MGSLKGLPFNSCENYGLGGLLPPKTTKGLKFKVLKTQFLNETCCFLNKNDAKLTFEFNAFGLKIWGGRSRGALRFRGSATPQNHQRLEIEGFENAIFNETCCFLNENDVK